jgi:hypothetical protein
MEKVPLPVPDDCEKVFPIEEFRVHAPFSIVKFRVAVAPNPMVVGVAVKLTILGAPTKIVTVADDAPPGPLAVRVTVSVPSLFAAEYMIVNVPLPEPDDWEKPFPIDELTLHVEPLAIVKLSVDVSLKLIEVGLAVKLAITGGSLMTRLCETTLH